VQVFAHARATAAAYYLTDEQRAELQQRLVRQCVVARWRSGARIVAQALHRCTHSAREHAL
jgi:hypothetical protein